MGLCKPHYNAAQSILRKLDTDAEREAYKNKWIKTGAMRQHEPNGRLTTELAAAQKKGR